MIIGELDLHTILNHQKRSFRRAAHKEHKARNLRMSKTYTQDKTQQDLQKYWNNTRSATKEKEQTKNSISSNSDPNTLEQLSIDNLKEKTSTDTNDKKRKAPVKEKTLEETSSPPLKRMYETLENKESMHKSSSSGNLQTNSNTNHTYLHTYIMSKEHEELKAKLISFENRTLENCLVFKGVTEGEYEKEGETRMKIKETLKNLISSNNAEEAERMANNFEIRRCRRLGKYFKDRSRPISVDFLRKDDTNFIMENKSYLPEGIYADREYSQDTERKRKLLRPILKAARMNKDFKGRCKLEKDTLVL